MNKYLPLLAATILSACSLDAATDRIFDPDAEFAKLDQPDVDSIEGTLLRSAKAAEEQGRYNKALNIYQQLVDKDRENMSYVLGFAESIRRTGDPQAAINYYDVVIKKEPKNVEAIEGKALALMAAGSFPEAGDAFKQVMTLDTQRWRTLNGLGVLFTLKEMYPEAQTYFDESLKFSPDNVSVLNNKGLSQAIAGEPDRAIEALEYASKLAGSDGYKKKNVDLNLALLYGVNGRPKDAERLAAQYFEGPMLNNNLGLYAHLANNDELAKSYLNMALSHSSSYYEKAWNNLDYVVGQSKGVLMQANPKAKSIKVK